MMSDTCASVTPTERKEHEMSNIEIFRERCEAQGLAWSEYCDLDEWSLSMLFDEFDYEEDGE